MSIGHVVINAQNASKGAEPESISLIVNDFKNDNY